MPYFLFIYIFVLSNQSTGRHAIDHFFSLCKDLRVSIPETMKYFCVTEAVSLYIQKYVQYRKRKMFFGTNGKIDDLVLVMFTYGVARNWQMCSIFTLTTTM